MPIVYEQDALRELVRHLDEIAQTTDIAEQRVKRNALANLLLERDWLLDLAWWLVSEHPPTVEQHELWRRLALREEARDQTRKEYKEQLKKRGL